MMINLEDRESVMVALYGEVTTKADAAKILSVSPSKIRAMVADGRLDTACEGAMIDVRSIARYIAAPAQMEETGRVNRIKAKNGTGWAV